YPAPPRSIRHLFLTRSLPNASLRHGFGARHFLSGVRLHQCKAWYRGEAEQPAPAPISSTPHNACWAVREVRGLVASETYLPAAPTLLRLPEQSGAFGRSNPVRASSQHTARVPARHPTGIYSCT